MVEIVSRRDTSPEYAPSVSEAREFRILWSLVLVMIVEASTLIWLLRLLNGFARAPLTLHFVARFPHGYPQHVCRAPAPQTPVAAYATTAALSAGLLLSSSVNVRVVTLLLLVGWSIALLVRAGVAGYLLKEISGDALLAAIRGAAQGRPQLHPEITARLMETPFGRTDPLEALTPRERDVL